MLKQKKKPLIILLTVMLILAAGAGLAVKTHQRESQIASIDAQPSAATSKQEASITSADNPAGQSVKVTVSNKNAAALTAVKAKSVTNTKPAAVKPAVTTKKAASTPTAASRKSTSSSSSKQTTSTSTPSRGGQRTLTMLATAYDPGPECNDQWAGISYLGTPLHYGIVAVDPNVIPLGSHLYIEGYGEGYAADTGGAIKGNRIDLCYDTYDEAMNFGMKYVKVTIIN